MIAQTERTSARHRLLHLPLTAYALASFLHYAHNAEMLQAYPHMPDWLTRPHIYGAWMAVTTVGVFGYWLMRSRHHVAGLAVLALYGALGFDGLGHYALAPFSRHTITMNATIWIEVAAATVVLVTLLRLLRVLQRSPAPAAAPVLARRRPF